MESKSSLAQARETAGLTVEQISALTNIRVAVIKDLENNSVDICGRSEEHTSELQSQR